jgi:hypothetical protein
LSDKVLALFDEGDSDRLAVESVLASHLVVLLHSECEQALKSAVNEKCSTITDAHLRNFALSMVDKATGYLKISELKGTLAKFSDDVKRMFHESIEADAGGVSHAWDRMCYARKVIAHEGGPSNMTVNEVKVMSRQCATVIALYRSALGLDNH